MILGQNRPFSRIWGSNPRISGTKKTTKNADEVSGFFHIFLVQIPVYGTPPTAKIVIFDPPPKIIKNRLNFARSHIREKSPKTVFFSTYANTPPKIIKNRLNFALSEKR